MANRRRFIPTVIAAALVALFLPLIASAQGNYDPWGRDRSDRNRDYRRDRDYDNNDSYGGRYNRSGLRESIRRLHDYAHQLERDLDRELDDSRENGTRHEDRLNGTAQSFRAAASSLKDRFDNGRDLNRSAGEARRVLDIGNQIGRRIQHHFGDRRIRSDWQRISQELRVIANAYGYGGGYGSGGYGRDNDNHGHDDDHNRRRNDNQRSNNDWWRRLPFQQ